MGIGFGEIGMRRQAGISEFSLPAHKASCSPLVGAMRCGQGSAWVNYERMKKAPAFMAAGSFLGGSSRLAGPEAGKQAPII